MPVDAISLEVFKSLFTTVATEMGVTLRRAAFSPNIRERLDFSCAVFDPTGRMVAQAAHIPVHLGSMPASVAAALAAFDRRRPGDVVILNDPFRGGTHLPDITLVSPVYHQDALVFFVASRAHHADVGGMAPGSLPLSTELFQEGIIIPPVKLIDGRRRIDGVFALITANSRTPDERIGDLEAQLAAHRIGERRLQDMIAGHGLARVNDHAAALLDYSRRMTEAIIDSIPDGVYDFEDAIEGDGQIEARLPIRVTISVKGAGMTVDFSESAPQVAGNLNAVEAIVQSATWYCIRLLAADDVPVNHGCFAPVAVITRPGTLLNPAFPAAVAVGNTETSQRIVDVVLGALAKALPDRLPAASQGTMNNIAFGGWDPERQRRFAYYETIGGGMGAGPRADGLSGVHTHMTNSLNTPVEALENYLPLKIRAYGLRKGSGGGGARRGGDGIVREYEFGVPVDLTVISERRRFAPYGARGGGPGVKGRNVVLSRGRIKVLGSKANVRLETGDRLRIETPGGGGHGRASRKVRHKESAR